MKWTAKKPQSGNRGSRQKRRGVFTRLGNHLDNLWRKVRGVSARAPQPGPVPPLEPLTPTEQFDDLKIARPKPGRVLPARSRLTRPPLTNSNQGRSTLTRTRLGAQATPVTSKENTPLVRNEVVSPGLTVESVPTSKTVQDLNSGPGTTSPPVSVRDTGTATPAEGSTVPSGETNPPVSIRDTGAATPAEGSTVPSGETNPPVSVRDTGTATPAEGSTVPSGETNPPVSVRDTGTATAVRQTTVHAPKDGPQKKLKSRQLRPPDGPQKMPPPLTPALTDSEKIGGVSNPADRPRRPQEKPKPPAVRLRPSEDYQPAAKSRLRLGLVILGLGLLVTTAVLLGLRYTSDSRPLTAKVARIPAASLPPAPSESLGLYERLAREYQSILKTEVTIAPGSSLGMALEAVGIGLSQQSPAIIDLLSTDDALGGVVRPGARILAFWADEDQTELTRLEYHPAMGGAPLVVKPKFGGGVWLYNLASQPLTINSAREGTVESSLWAAGSKAGLDANIIMSLTDILASDMDFITDIKSGATFQVLYSRDYRDGRPVGSPTIDMVKMVNRGKDYEFYRYVNSKGQSDYFDPKGRSNRKTFFLSPLQYKRISSHFSMTRLHPIYKKVRPHQGVDYAAPSGTPISAVADGTVIFCGWSGGFGRLVTIKHNDTYTTMYAHMSRFAPGLKKGSVVKQGDLIGNVGATGVATGPHLDFRLKKNGVYIDPVPELAKQQGKLLEAVEAQAFTQVVTQYRNRMTYQLNNNAPSS